MATIELQANLQGTSEATAAARLQMSLFAVLKGSSMGGFPPKKDASPPEKK
jgi:hypothetical protein